MKTRSSGSIYTAPTLQFTEAPNLSTRGMYHTPGTTNSNEAKRANFRDIGRFFSFGIEHRRRSELGPADGDTCPPEPGAIVKLTLTAPSSGAIRSCRCGEHWLRSRCTFVAPAPAPGTLSAACRSTRKTPFRQRRDTASIGQDGDRARPLHAAEDSTAGRAAFGGGQQLHQADGCGDHRADRSRESARARDRTGGAQSRADVDRIVPQAANVGDHEPIRIRPTVQRRADDAHLGVDFSGAMGEPIRAANRGVVALVDNFFLAGNVVYIDHGGGVVTAYFHMSKTLVSAGDTVERGQVIGLVGNTGRVTGPHLALGSAVRRDHREPTDLTSWRRAGTALRRPEAVRRDHRSRASDQEPATSLTPATTSTSDRSCRSTGAGARRLP